MRESNLSLVCTEYVAGGAELTEDRQLWKQICDGDAAVVASGHVETENDCGQDVSLAIASNLG
jgi:hypothetical protein